MDKAHRPDDGGLLPRSTNISRVLVDGEIASRDSNLDVVPEFIAETDRGNRYRVARDVFPGEPPYAWTVFQLHGDTDEPTLVGHIQQHRWQRRVYNYWKEGSLFRYQDGDLWNTAQRLMV